MEGTGERRNRGGTKALGHGGVGGTGRTGTLHVKRCAHFFASYGKGRQNN